MRSVPGAGSVSEVPRTAPEWRWALPRIALLFVATRLLLLAIAAVVEATQTAPPAGVRWTDAPLLASLTAFDGRYYLGIAASGYHAAPVYGPFVDVAFFPLYPLLVRIASVLTLGDIDLAGILVANAAFGCALVALYALSVRHLSRDVAMRSLVFLALAPGAVGFAMAYTDGLFLLLAVSAFLAAETRRPALMGILLALATLTRPPGILLALPLLVLVLQDLELRRRRAWAWLGLAPLALMLFSAYLGALTGDPLAWLHAQAIWGRPSTSAGGAPVVAGAGSGPVGIVDASPLILLLWFGTFLFYLLLFVFVRVDRMPVAYVLVALLPLVGVFSAGRLMSAPRFLAVAWPFDWALALRRARWFRYGVMAGFVGMQVAIAWLAFTWQAAP